MKRAIIILVLIAVVGAGAGAYYISHNGQQISVQTAPISRGDIIDAVASTGTLQPVISVTVGSQVSGNIAWLGADFNSIVKKGQVIAKLDPTLFESQVAQAKAQLSQSKASLEQAKAQLIKDTANASYQKVTYERNRDLQKQSLISQDQLDQSKAAADQSAASLELDKSNIQQATANIEQATAQLNTSQTNLEHSIISSPIDGIVTQRSVDVGQTVAASMTAPQLFVIAEDLTRMQVSANIDESDVGRVTPGQDVSFRVDAFPGIDFHGTVAQIRLNPTVVNNVTTYATMISVPNTDLRLKPGMTTNLKIQVSRRSDALRVPNSAIRFRPSVDTFAALNQPVPPEALGGGRGRRGGAGGQGGQGAGGRADASNAAPNGASTPSAASQATRQMPASGSTSAPAQPGPAAQGNSGGFGRGGGFGGGGGGFANDPERQARMMERFKSMSPDEQQQFLARMKGRGADTSAFEQLSSGPGKTKAGGKSAPKKSASANAQGGFVFQPRYGAAQSGEEIQELFKPLPTTQSPGRVWLFVDKQLKAINLRLGITDGTFTELVNGDLEEGTEVVTGVTGVSPARSAATAAGNPLLGQQQNQRGGFGGPGGFGGGGGGGRGR
jgi:HlyD family secretion protein